MLHKGKIQTVLGPIDPNTLGITLPHEHVLIDMTKGACSAESLIEATESAKAAASVVAAGWEPGEDGPGTAATWGAKWNEPICLGNRADVARNWFYYGNYKINSIDDVIEEANAFKRHGGTCIVDQTSIGLARDPQGLRQVSHATGIHIVMATSYYTHEYHPGHVATLSIDEICERIVRDLDTGVSGGIQAGIIGEVGLSTPMHPDEEKVLRASVRAQKLTGAALSIHPGFGPDSIWDAVRVIEEEGGDLSRTIMCHVEHRLPDKPAPRSFEPEPFLRLAETGVYLELDCFGWEESFRQRGKIDMPNDAIRLNYIAALADAGYERKVLMSHDIALQHWQRKYGGHGWQHIPESVTALMRYKGFDEELIDKLLVQNPRDILTIA
ncbi:phosphotriesterase family protein [Parahaliea aestuarii]|uniref:Phosphotriesterase-related protein n=1 Tax=Parahaliea aestuarii TaxID=1852021 RepID=A0A5C8ZS79_9GAMM|nr:hypothetical protein [Parahaliea aestuarii]TXS90589.1 hypothetical protein FVW59_14745 [Parahaliea aestuarii]